MAKKLSQSRPARWMRAAQALREGVEALEAAVEEHQGKIESALDELRELRDEYEQWYESMPEGLQQSRTGEMLQEIVSQLEIPEGVELESLQEVIDFGDVADQVELPQGFGRD